MHTLLNLKRWSTVDGKFRDKVVAKRIGDMLAPVRCGTFARRQTLDEDAQHGNHRQATVLNFLNLQESQILRVRRDVVKVQGSTRVDRVQVSERIAGKLALERHFTRRCRIRFGTKVFRGADQDNLGSKSEEQPELTTLSATGTSQEDRTRFSPVAAGDAERFRDDNTRDGKHRPSGVDDFRDAVLLDFATFTQTERVKTVITRERTVEVGRNICRRQETGRQIQLAVRTYVLLSSNVF